MTAKILFKACWHVMVPWLFEIYFKMFLDIYALRLCFEDFSLAIISLLVFL